jgi:hypothetical protein
VSLSLDGKPNATAKIRTEFRSHVRFVGAGKERGAKAI